MSQEVLSPNPDPYADDRLKELPPGVWTALEYTKINAAVMHAELGNSALISSSQRPRDYQLLIDAYAGAALSFVRRLKDQGLPIVEYTIAANQLSVYFYEPLDVWRNYRLYGPDPAVDEEQVELEREIQGRKGTLAFKALRAALQFKNIWLAHHINMQRLQDQLEPLELNIGLHAGQVHLCEREDGRKRIEGLTTCQARWAAQAARIGKFSHIMVSRQTYETLRGSIVNDTMLRQRLFFHQHELFQTSAALTIPENSVYELKFYHRLIIDLPLEVIRQYDFMFEMDHSSIWAYYELFSYYAYVAGDWDKAAQLAERAQLAHPNDEKVLLDLSYYYAQQKSYLQARHLAERALELNSDFDLVYEHLATLAAVANDTAAYLLNLSRSMVLASGSPANHLNYGLVLCQADKQDEGGLHLIEAMKRFPGYLKRDEFINALKRIKQSGQLPATVDEYLKNNGYSL